MSNRTPSSFSKMTPREQADWVLYHDQQGALYEADSTFDYMFDRYYSDDPRDYASPYGLGLVSAAIEKIARQVHFAIVENASKRPISRGDRRYKDPLNFIKPRACILIVRALFKEKKPKIWRKVGYDRIDDE